MKNLKCVFLCIGALLFSAAASGEVIEVNGTFKGDSIPGGWSPNKPGYWDDEGVFALKKVPDTDKTALELTSKTKKMHIYTKQYAVAKGDKLELKAMVRGKGACSLGAYFYPGAGWVFKEFNASEEWTEVTAELTFQDTAEKVSIVIGITPGSSVEFLELRAEIRKKE